MSCFLSSKFKMAAKNQFFLNNLKDNDFFKINVKENWSAQNSTYICQISRKIFKNEGVREL